MGCDWNGECRNKRYTPIRNLGRKSSQIYKKRFENRLIERLLKIKWWDWPDEEILGAAKYMNDITVFVEKYDKKEKIS